MALKKSRGLIIFDADDTLWETSSAYVKTREDFFSVLEKKGFNREEAISCFDSLEFKRRNHPTEKTSRHRFPESMLLTYSYLCGKYQKDFAPETEAELIRIGYNVYNHTYALFPDTESSLKSLVKNYILYVHTCGDPKIQNKKIQKHQKLLKAYFKRIEITPFKDVAAWKKIIDSSGFDIKDVWVVGDSLRADIKPALQLGANAVLRIKPQASVFDDTEIPHSPRFHMVHSLAEACVIIRAAHLEQDKEGRAL
jgi:putative hydrolase of the HAD superfamily